MKNVNRNSNQIILASGYPRQKYNKQNHTHITANKSNKKYKQRNRPGAENNEDQSLKLRNIASI